jgi:hypothetical protein
MSLVKYWPNGKPKNMVFDNVMPCKSCKDGEIFVKEIDKRTQLHAADTFEPICGVCTTKYIFPLEEENKLVSKACIDCSSYDGQDFCPVNNDSWLCPGATRFIWKTISLELEEAKKMAETPEFVAAWDEFEKTKECKKHFWITSQPFNTNVGSFQLETCRICKLGRTTYKGKVIEDNIMKLVNFLAEESIKVDKKESDKMKQFKDFGKVKAAVPDFGFLPPTPAKTEFNFV